MRSIILRNKIDEEEGIMMLAQYVAGTGTATIARLMGLKQHVVENFVKKSGIMRDRRVGAAMALREMAKRNAGKSNKERMR